MVIVTCVLGSSLSTAIEIQIKDGSWKKLNALLNLGADLNFISQIAVKEVTFNKSDRIMKVVTTLNSHALPMYREHDMLTCSTDTISNINEHSNYFYTIDIQGYNTVLGYL